MKCFAIVLVLFVILCSVCHISGYEDFDDWEETRQLRTRALKLKDQRRYQTKEELELTNAVPKIDSKPCKSQHPIAVFIHSAGRSSGKNFDKRQATRKTWASDLKKLNISVYFATALSKNETINEELRGEADKYEDILQFSFIDAYYNLTLKAISILRWINKKCLTSTHILKTDDDVVVNSRMLLDKLSAFRTGISGYRGIKNKPYRDLNHKWGVPHSVYPKEYYPAYVSGGAYMISGNITHILTKTIDEYSGNVLVIDDLFITGIIAEKAGIERHSTDLISFIGCENVCPLHEKAVIFECKDAKEMQDFWAEWKTTSYEFCRNMFHIKIGLFVMLGLLVIGCVICALILCSYYLYKKYRK